MQINGRNIEEFIANAAQGKASKEEVMEMLELVQGIWDDTNNDVATTEDCLQQMKIRGEYDGKDLEKAKEIAPNYGVSADMIDKLASNREARSTVARLVSELEKVRDTFKNFNKQNCFANIRALLKEKPEIKIGMIEKEAGIRLGYMARLEKADNTSEPSMEFITSAAKLLGVTVDMLISGQIAGLNGNERFVLSFLDTLITDTLSGDITWEKESPKELESVAYTDGKPNHILMKHAVYYEIGPSGYPEVQVERTEYNSLFFNDNMRIDLQGNVYHIELPRTDTTVYIVHISHEIEGLPFPDNQYEVAIYQDYNLTGLCGSCQSVPEIKQQIIKLYKTIDEMNSGLGLNDSIKNTLGFYMSTSSPSASKKQGNQGDGLLFDVDVDDLQFK